MVFRLLPLLLLFLCSCQNFHVVEPGRLYRSARPSRETLRAWVQKYELKTVVRLLHGAPDTTDADVTFEHVPMSAGRYPSKKTILRLWSIFEQAEYPLLLHCRAGADRTSFASALYVLQKTGDVNEALKQLRFFPYLHSGLFGTYRLDNVLYMYRPYQKRMGFVEWVQDVYEIPPKGCRAQEPRKLASESR